MKIALQSRPFTNAEPLRMPIAEANPDELQPVNPAINPNFLYQSEARI